MFFVEVHSEFGDGDERNSRQEQNMSSDDDEASLRHKPQQHVTRVTIENADAHVTNAKRHEPETIDKLSNVQNDSSKSLNTDSAYGSTNQGHSFNRSNSFPNGEIETVLSTNEEEDSLLGSSVANSSMSHRSGRRSIARGVSRSNSIHIVYSVEPASDDTYEPFSFWSSSRRQKTLLAAMATVDFTSNMCLSILAPFFPDEVRFILRKMGLSREHQFYSKV